MKYTPIKKIIAPKPTAGFAMLFAVLASSLLVSIGISIFNISLKQLMIATSERDSQTAYYASDSAQECALYWDIKVGAFPACLDDTCTTPSTTTNNTIVCNGEPIVLSFDRILGTDTYQDTISSFFKYSTTTVVAPDSGITITKEFFSGSPDYIKTSITSQGHNTGIVGRRVERGISQTHNN